MALNFPDNPTTGQLYTDSTAGFTYEWDGYVWQSYTAAAAANIKIIDDLESSFNNVTVTFALTSSGNPVTPINPQQLRIVLGGIVQEPAVDYNVAGSDIIFTTAPTTGLSFSGVLLGGALSPVGLASTGSVYVRQSYSPTGVQTTFTVSGGYRIGYLDVYHNGVKLVVTDDYTATNGSTFDLVTPAQNGDTVEAVTFLYTQLYSTTGILDNLLVTGNATVTGVTTLGNTVVGGGTTQLLVNGNARVTGILTVGTSSITLNGSTDTITTGTLNATTITGSLTGDATGLTGTPNVTVGVVTATSFYGDGSGLTGAGSTVADDTSTNATFYPVLTQTTSGTITASKVSTTKLNFNPSTGTLTATQVNDAGGNLRALANNAKTGSYTLVIGDVGELINITTGGVTVPSGIFSAGDSVTIYNNSSSSQTITQGASTTLRLAGTSLTGNRTLDQRGITTVMCVASNEFVISGAGLS